ncbi:MAG TPA: hypothetical protein VLJ86_06535 [Ramlibacter sp.]|nr:hypothetical protein [Ramlibacter sp.]
MSVFASPRFVRNVLLADAASGLASGALQLAFTGALASALQLPAALLYESGLFLVAYGAALAVLALRRAIPRALVGLVMVGNVGWAVGCVALLATGALAPTALGAAWVLAQAACVAVFAELQFMALRRASTQAWA